MDVNSLGATKILIDYRNTNSRLERSLERLSSGRRVATAKDDPILWSEMQGLKSDAMNLMGYSDNLSRAASTVNIALGSMDVSRSHLLQAEAELNAAFSAAPGSSERIDALNNYNEMLEFVDDAAMSPDPQARALLQDPLVYPAAGAIDVRAGENGFMLRLDAREIHTGAAGLDLPRAGAARPSDLTSNPSAPPVIADVSAATNQEIDKMIELLVAAKEKLSSQVRGLTVDAAALQGSEDFNAAFIALNEGHAEELNVVDLNAEAVLVQSLQLKGELSISGLSGLGDTLKMAIQLLK